MIHRKNDFAEIFKNLDKYRSENNFIELYQIITQKFMNNTSKLLTF